jgi:outer membrane protein assembly factor BamB
MSNVIDPGNSTPRKPVRLWPGVVIAVLMLLVTFVLPLVAPDGALFAMVGGVAGALAIVLWWVFFSRVPWLERLGFVAVAIVAMLVTSRFIHVSIAGAGQGMLFPVLGFQWMCFAFVVGAVASQRVPAGLRRATMVATILIASGMWTAVRTDGISGAGGQWALRWTPTPEERLLAMAADEPKPLASAPAAAETPKELPAPKPVDESPAVSAASPTAKTEPAAAAPPSAPASSAETPPGRAMTRVEWPGFRGPERDGVVRGVRIQTDWSASPPVQMWRRPIGRHRRSATVASTHSARRAS